MGQLGVLCACVILLLCPHVQSAVVGPDAVPQQEIIDSADELQDIPQLLIHSAEGSHSDSTPDGLEDPPASINTTHLQDPNPTPDRSLGSPTLVPSSEGSQLLQDFDLHKMIPQILGNSVIDEQDVVDVATATAPPLSNEHEGFDGYDRFIAGLSKLVAILNDPDYNWETHGLATTPFSNSSLPYSPQEPISTSTSPPNCTCSECTTSSPNCNCSDCSGAATTSSPPTSQEHTALHPIESLFALVATMKQLSEGMQRRAGKGEQTVEGERDEADVVSDDGSNSIITDGQGRVYESVEEYLVVAGSNRVPQSPHPAALEHTSPFSHVNITTAVKTLSSLYQHYFGQNTATEGHNEEDGLKALVENAEALSNALHNYSSALHFYSSSNSTPSFDYNATSNTSFNNHTTSTAHTTSEDENGLQKILVLLKRLLGLQLPHTSSPPPPTTTTTTTTTTTATTTTTTTARGGYAPCEPPFEEIAYRMCILQEVTLRLGWDAAQLYCRERGAELARDPVVVKARRYLNDLYGEDGSRVRWPMWIGGKRVEDGSWRWQDGSEVMGFLWCRGQPRYYAQPLIPHGTCMILDGYQSYYGASLPCHLRRRFVCQRLN